MSLLYCFIFIFGGASIGCLIHIFCMNIFYTNLNLFVIIIENLQNIELLKATLLGGSIGLAFTIVYTSAIHLIRKNSNPKEERKEAKRHNKGLDYEITALETLIFKLKSRKELLLLQKEKEKIKQASSEIKTINYREELEREKAYLKEKYNQGYDNALVEIKDVEENLEYSLLRYKK